MKFVAFCFFGTFIMFAWCMVLCKDILPDKTIVAVLRRHRQEQAWRARNCLSRNICGSGTAPLMELLPAVPLFNLPLGQMEDVAICIDNAPERN